MMPHVEAFLLARLDFEGFGMCRLRVYYPEILELVSLPLLDVAVKYAPNPGQTHGQ
jgi:hypothetical protein